SYIVIIDGIYHCFSKQALKTAKPAGATNTDGPLTKPLIEVTVMAMNKHTQTRPKYQYRFLAVSRQDRSVPPFRLCIDAGSEQEARRLLAPYFILSFAGQLPAQEARNA
ncbi:host cell division inhibitor Icd-like protein, partial [Pantoea septica]|uniref:host cell division inhibitor Icd-like protein n=2 Tax=Erwiniaceae TaxID=1903409 RepID=UPI0028AFCA1A